jgi:hypothetical protein
MSPQSASNLPSDQAQNENKPTNYTYEHQIAPRRTVPVIDDISLSGGVLEAVSPRSLFSSAAAMDLKSGGSSRNEARRGGNEEGLVPYDGGAISEFVTRSSSSTAEGGT